MEQLKTRKKPIINNEIYHTLRERWYEGQDDPTAMLRAESRFRNPWVLSQIARNFPGRKTCDILDVGCGGGLLANVLARAGHRVTGLDCSAESLRIARRFDSTQSVNYILGDALSLSFADASFDVVSAMDFLEHVDRPDIAIREASRVLRPGGLFFFHTFNRNPLSRLIAIKGMEWFVKNTPKNLHVYHLFIKPSELRAYCLRNGLQIETFHGVRPRFLSKAFLRLLLTRTVPFDFDFRFSCLALIAYIGIARKRGEHAQTI